jgi:phosphoglycolate phosphatase
VWDWNGTLLDDVDRCLRAMNRVLVAFGRVPIADRARYRSLFRFPIGDFYADVGIGDDDFRDAADLYLSVLESDPASASLHAGTHETLAALADLGIRQVLASATLPDLLETQLSPYGVRDAFERVITIDDHYAPSKLAATAQWLRGSGLDAAEVVFVGDTNHDHEIAEALGARFIHCSGGHQRFIDDDVEQIDALPELLDLLQADAVRTESRTPTGTITKEQE